MRRPSEQSDEVYRRHQFHWWFDWDGPAASVEWNCVAGWISCSGMVSLQQASNLLKQTHP